MLEARDLPRNLVIMPPIGCLDYLQRIGRAVPALAGLEVAMPVGIRPEMNRSGTQQVEDSVRHSSPRGQDRLGGRWRQLSKRAGHRRAM